MSDYLGATQSDDYHIVLRQRDLADAWVFDAKWDGCVNFGQIRPETTDAEGNGGEVDGWDHICDLDLLIELLTELREKRNAVFPDLAKDSTSPRRDGVGSPP